MNKLGEITGPSIQSLITYSLALLLSLTTLMVFISIFTTKPPKFVNEARPWVGEECCPCNNDSSNSSE